MRYVHGTKRIRLERATLSVETRNGKNTAVTIPAESVVEVLTIHTNGDGLVDVGWEGRTLAIFQIDMEERGTEVLDLSATTS